MRRCIKHKILFLFVFIGGFSFAQKTEKDTEDKPTKQKPTSEFVFKPTIGLGAGMLSFYGDIYDKHFQPPMVSRFAYELNIAQPINDNFQLDFYVMRGKLAANERFVAGSRNLNFESQITTGGLNVMYSFGHFLKKERTASPYITLGIEAFEFLSKTDLYDQYGNKYNYWEDGTIRNKPATDPDAANATVIDRDYKYESDIRTLNLDGFGKYSENSFAIPVGLGFTFKINDHVNVKMGATMHYTFTDYIDGITQNSLGTRAGNSKKDNFMMSSFSVHYDFHMKRKDKEDELDEPLTADDLLAMDYADADTDGVVDLKDNCPGTPHGVSVDAGGCPLDDDLDGIPNYMDEEANTPAGAFVDAKGVQMSDSLLLYQYNVYIDSTGAFAKVEVHDHNGKTFYDAFYNKEYSVSLGQFKKALPAEMSAKFLSVNDISSNLINDSTTMYSAGKYTSALDAEKRKQELIEQGFADAKVVYKQKGTFHDAPPFKSNVEGGAKEKLSVAEGAAKGADTKGTEKENKTGENAADNKSVKETAANGKTKPGEENKESNKTNKETSTENKTAAGNAKGLVMRVQLGAFQKRLPKNAFRDIHDLIEIKTEDGLYKYSTGAFTSIEEAAQHKATMILNGYQDAFIAAYRDGKRVSIVEGGATPLKKGEMIENLYSDAPMTIDKKDVTFRVQVGLYTNQVPNERLAIFTKLKDIKGELLTDGATRYSVGQFTDYKKAEEYRDMLIKKYGLADAFVIAFSKSDLITVEAALESMKK